MHTMKMKPIMTIATDKAVPASRAIQKSVISFPHNVEMVCCPQAMANTVLIPSSQVGQLEIVVLGASGRHAGELGKLGTHWTLGPSLAVYKSGSPGDYTPFSSVPSRSFLPRTKDFLSIACPWCSENQFLRPRQKFIHRYLEGPRVQCVPSFLVGGTDSEDPVNTVEIRVTLDSMMIIFMLLSRKPRGDSWMLCLGR